MKERERDRERLEREWNNNYDCMSKLCFFMWPSIGHDDASYAIIVSSDDVIASHDDT